MTDTDTTLRYAPSRILVVSGGAAREMPVTRYVAHPPGARGRSPIIAADLVALELVTEGGSRWYGFDEAYINSELRMVVRGFGARDEVRMKWEPVPDLDRAKPPFNPADGPMTPEQAWLYAAGWGSYMNSSDPGACMYGFDEYFRVQSEEHRQQVREHIEKVCRPMVLADPDDYEPDELARMDAFLAALAAAPVEET